MRRTYRSKKDDGSLDHKNMASRIDARSSAFDAFYIHNIKLNKKEISPSGSKKINITSKKIRKRKYVKRIVNDASQREFVHAGEFNSQSALLTPDKSIHVNKAPDPFDLLLRSSPTFAKSPILEQKLRQKLNIKKETKINCSIVDRTDLDNVYATTTVKSLCCNTSDIKSHKLLFEVEDTSDPKSHDKSISRIVKRIPILKDMNKDSQFKFIKDTHRLTTTYGNSPAAGNSPLCSTPFQLKYFSKSNFNISPISINFNESPKVVNTMNGSSSGEEDENKSQCETSVKIESMLDANAPKGEVNHSPRKDINIGQQASLNLKSEELHSLSTSEVEPCYGFAEISMSGYLKPHSKEIGASQKSTDQTLSEYKNIKFQDEVSKCAAHSLLSDSLVDEKLNTTDKCASKHGTCSTGYEDYTKTCLLNDNNYLQKPNPVVALEKMDESMFCRYYKKYKSMGTINRKSKVFNDLTNSKQKGNVIELSNILNNTYYGNNLEGKENIELSNASDNTDYGNNTEVNVNMFELSNASHNTDYGNNTEVDVNLFELSNASHNTDYGNNTEVNGNLFELSNASCDTDKGNNVEEKEDLIELSNASQNTDYVNDMEVNVNLFELSNASCDTDDGNNVEEKEDLIELSNASHNTDYGNNTEVNGNLFELSNASNNTDYGSNVEEKGNSIDISNTSYNTDCDNNFYSMNSISPENTNQEFKDSFKTNSSLKEDAGISYVTTRRRQENVNDSIILLPDDSYDNSIVKQDTSTIGNNISVPTVNEKRNVASSDEYGENEIVPTSNETLGHCIVSKHEDSVLQEQVSARSGSGSFVEDNATRVLRDTKSTDCDIAIGTKVPIVLQPGKKWERSLSIYKRMTTIADNNHSLLDYEQTESKGRKYRQSVIDTIQMQRSICSLHNESINGRRSTFICKPIRSTIKLVKENSNSRASLCPSTAYEDLKGFLSDDCDDTIVDLSKLSIGESVHEVTVVENFHEASRIATARDYVLRRCNQTEPLLFDECYPDTALKNCHKIGEGVYGEVFLWRARDGIARVLKVIPIAGDIKVNGEPQKGYHEIISEIVIAMELSALRAPIHDIEKRLDEGKELDALDLHSVENATDIFNEVLGVRCVHGAYPSRLLELWELYDECRGSDNDNPAALPPCQHYLVLELRNAGRDLESYSFTGADQAYAVLLQLAFGLGVAEEALQFEHRDLHWGNVLVAPTDQEYATFLLRGRVHRVLRRGAACVVIDYSLSRVSLRGAALYADLADDDSLFEAVGDRQFDVYRLMRDRLGNEWKNFEPHTNVLWLHYVADKMVTALRYERPATKLHRHYLGRLRAARRTLLAHASAADFALAHAHAHAAL